MKDWLMIASIGAGVVATGLWLAACLQAFAKQIGPTDERVVVKNEQTC